MDNLIANDAFMKMVYSIIFWIVLYIIVKTMTVKSGIGTNLLGQCLKQLDKFKSEILKFKTVCKAKNISNDKLMKGLALIIKKEKRILKIIDMYLFDDKRDSDVNAARSLVGSSSSICRKVVSDVTDGDFSKLDVLFNELDKNLNNAKSFIDNAIKLDMKKKILQI